MPAEQNLKLVRSFQRTGLFSNRIQAAQVGLTGYDNQDENKYTKLSTRALTDLPEQKYSEVAQKAFYLYQRNPLAKRMIEILVDYCVNEELSIKIKKMKRVPEGDKQIDGDNSGQQAWDDFFEDPYNHLDEDLAKLITDFFLNGEMCLPAEINKMNGKVWLGFICTQYIKEVYAIKGNNRIIDRVEFFNPVTNDKFTKKVIRWNIEGTPIDNKDYGKLSGEMFYFQGNRLPSQMRGYSFLLEHIDWLDSFDNFLFNVLQGFDAKNKHFIDIEVQGAKQEELDGMTIAIPENGEANLHNEKVKVNPVTFNLNSSEATTAVQLIMDFITGTKGFPKTWFGKGDETNRATAEALTEPTLKMIKRIQKLVKYIIKQIAEFVLQEHKSLNLREGEYWEVEVSTFDLNRKDIDTMGIGITNLIQALILAKNNNWIKDENCKKVIDSVFNSYGIETDTSETIEDIKDANDIKEAKEIYDKTDVPFE